MDNLASKENDVNEDLIIRRQVFLQCVKITKEVFKKGFLNNLAWLKSGNSYVTDLKYSF